MTYGLEQGIPENSPELDRGLVASHMAFDALRGFNVKNLYVHISDHLDRILVLVHDSRRMTRPLPSRTAQTTLKIFIEVLLVLGELSSIEDLTPESLQWVEESLTSIYLDLVSASSSTLSE